MGAPGAGKGGCGERGVCWSGSIFQLGEVLAVTRWGSRRGSFPGAEDCHRGRLSQFPMVPALSCWWWPVSNSADFQCLLGPTERRGCLVRGLCASDHSKAGEVRREKSLTGLGATKDWKGQESPAVKMSTLREDEHPPRREGPSERTRRMGFWVPVGSGACGDWSLLPRVGWPGRLDTPGFGSSLLFTEILWLLLLPFMPQFVCSAFQLEVCPQPLRASPASVSSVISKATGCSQAQQRSL